jgi:arabinan endo-1,5-alpha-L-arabinosidase
MKTHPFLNASAGILLAVMVVALSACVVDAQISNSPAAASPAAASRSAESEWLVRAGSRGVRVHDPSTIVKCKDEFWVFYTGRGVRSYRSKDLVNWTPGPMVFTNQLSWVTNAVPHNRSGMDFWAPDIIHVGDRYLLYFSASSFGKNTSAIGLATNPTLDPDDPNYKWTDQGIVIQSGPSQDFNTIDPAITQDADGNLWLAFGSFWSGIRMIQLDPKTGKRISPDSPVHSLAHFDSIEAAYIYPHDNRYYLFVNWGMCCRGVNSTYNLRVGRSDKITGPYFDKTGKSLLLGGGSLVLDTTGPFVGPGHAGIISAGGTNWLSCHFYDATRFGSSTLAIMPLRWDENGWPAVDLPAQK